MEYFQQSSQSPPESYGLHDRLSKLSSASQNGQPTTSVHSDKRLRNKLAAKESRHRKKQYIEVLQCSIQQITNSLQEVQAEIEETREIISKSGNTKYTLNIGPFAPKRQSFLTRLTKCLQKPKSLQRDEEINVILDSISYRVGATGRERVEGLNEQFRQIVNMTFPPMHRYMLWASSANAHIFGAEKQGLEPSWRLDPSDPTLVLTDSQYQEARKLRPQLIKLNHQLVTLMRKLFAVKGRLKECHEDIEDTFAMIRDVMTPTQCAQLFLFVHKNKYRKEFYMEDTFQTSSKRVKID